MANNPYHLSTASELEDTLGEKYFYRQRIYRLAQSGKIPDFKLRGQTCFITSHVVQAFLKDLELHIQDKFPELDISSLRVFYDTVTGKRIVIDGIFGGHVSVDTSQENEEDLLVKVGHVIEWIGTSQKDDVVDELSSEPTEPAEDFNKQLSNVNHAGDSSLANVLPEEILWVRVSESIIENVEVKSKILISLSSIAQFIGVRTDAFSRWVSNKDLSSSILSVHIKQIQGPQNSVPWKKGIVDGLTPMIPFERVPELIVAYRQSGNNPKYQEKAELLYQLSSSTLQAVGLAVSGTKDRAAEELAKVGKELGLNAADQIIAIFKQYETKEFQVQTTKEFNSKVKTIGANFAATTGSLTVGITGRYPSEWKALGTSRKLPKKLTVSSREVMRELAPGDGVGMTFGEKHFIKQPNITEAIQTGKQGKDFYNRLKGVGLLDDTKDK